MNRVKLPPAKIRTLVSSLFQVIPSRCTTDEIVCVCEEPGCNDQSGNRSVSLKTGKTNCWRCGRGGDLLTWLQHLGHEPDVSDLSLYESHEVSIADIQSLGQPAARRLNPIISDISLPRGFTLLAEEPDGCYSRLIEKMARRKNLDLETFERAGAGFTRDSTKWEPYCIFPVTEYGRMAYYQGRTYTDVKGESTKRFPSRHECPLGSRYWVYNIDKLRDHGKICVVVESIFNVLSLENVLGPDSDIVPVAIFKHKISPEQQVKIMSAKGVKEVNLMFDHDALASAWASCKNLTNLVKVTVTDGLPKGVDANDDAELAAKCFDRRSEYNVINSIATLADEL